MAEDSRKRRKTHPQPDGFQIKPQQHLHVPTFRSAFDSPHTSIPLKKLITKPLTFPPRPPPAQQNKSVNVQEISSRLSRQSALTFPVCLDPQSTKSTIPMKRHEPPTVPTVSRLTTAVKPLSTSSYFMKEPQALPALTAKPLQRRAPPIPELPPAVNNSKEMKPLSTTHFASLIDASTDEDDDSADVSALLFRLQEHDVSIQSSQHKTDILISPQKDRHVRRGLAGRTTQLFKKFHTSLYLWRIALEGQPLQQTSSDLSFRVRKIVHTISTGSCRPCISITLCRILTPIRPFTSRKQLVYILLKLPDASKSSPLCNPKDLQEGITVHIWRPWHEMALVHFPPGTFLEMPNPSLPIPSSNDSSSVSFDAAEIHNTVLLCSRFLIPQQSI